MGTRSAASLLIVVLAAAPGFAGTTAINPNNYGNGQTIAASGVTLETETVVQSGTDSTGNPLYVPTFGSVYSYNTGTGCMNGAFPCTVVGTSLFAPSPTGALSGTPNFGAGGFWGTTSNDTPALECSLNCVLNADAGGSILLRADFAAPTNFVDVLAFFNGGDPTEIAAFDTAGNLVGEAFNGVGSGAGWGDATISTATPDISTVLIGGHDSFRAVNMIDYTAAPAAAPEIDTASAASGLTLLLGGLLVLRGRRVQRSDK